jgi:hypothetical protein
MALIFKNDNYFDNENYVLFDTFKIILKMLNMFVRIVRKNNYVENIKCIQSYVY